MPADAEHEPAPPTTNISRKLGITAIALIILPVILPFPLWGLASLWIGPLDYAAWEQCRSFYCPAAAHWESMEMFLTIGPSMLIAAASILLGMLGLRSKRLSTLPGDRPLFWASFWCGILWFVILGVILQLLVSIAGEVV
jgi:hypothetical protein